MHLPPLYCGGVCSFQDIAMQLLECFEFSMVLWVVKSTIPKVSLIYGSGPIFNLSHWDAFHSIYQLHFLSTGYIFVSFMSVAQTTWDELCFDI